MEMVLGQYAVNAKHSYRNS